MPLKLHLGKQAVNASSGGDNENAGPKEAFKYDLIEHFKHILALLHILDLLRMSPQTRDSLISELQRLNMDVDKHAPQVLQIEMDYRVKKSKPPQREKRKKLEDLALNAFQSKKPQVLLSPLIRKTSC